MIYAFDTFYTENQAKTVCVGFAAWTSEAYAFCISAITAIDTENEYVSGQFYKRELPCIINLLAQIDLQPDDLIVIDGFVVLDDTGAYGLGGHLYEYLGRKYPVVGVAKTNFASLNTLKRPVWRGESKSPLYITALGIDLDEAASQVQSMHGPYRMPLLLQQLDGLSKS